MTSSNCDAKTLTFYPFAYALLDDELDNYCWYCLADKNDAAENGTLRKCSGCKVARFCNKNCQNSGWPDHKGECRGLAKLPTTATPPPDVEVRMLGRIVWRYKTILRNNEKNDNFWTNRGSQRTIMQICDHAEDMRRDKVAYAKFRSIYDRLIDFYDRKYLPDEETVFQLHCRNYINRHALSDGAYLKEIGKGLYLDLCQYDHSCRPNTVYTCRGFVATLRPLNDDTDVTKIQSTFYTYIDLLMCKQERRKALLDSWYFQCQCPRCSDEGEHVLTSVRCDECSGAVCIFEKEGCIKKIVECSNCSKRVEEDKVDRAISSMRFLDRFLNNELNDFKPLEAMKILIDLIEEQKVALHNMNIYYVRLLQAAILRTDPDDTETLLKYHLEATDCMRVCYPKNHPALSYHILNIGIFSCKLNKHREAKSYLNEALEMLTFVLGTDHSMTKQALEWLAVCQSHFDTSA